jgi:putative transposase
MQVNIIDIMFLGKLNNKEVKRVSEKAIRCQIVYVKKGHKLYEYFKEVGKNTNNLYNTTNYYIRQAYFGLIHKKIDPNINEAISYINDSIPEINKTRDRNASEHFRVLNENNPFLSYEVLDSTFRINKNIDYYSLPSHSNQQVMKEVFEAWKAYFSALKDYKKNPNKYLGKPRPPKYCKKGSVKTSTFSNQTCKIKGDGKTLKFPKTKNTLNIGKLFDEKDFVLKEVRVKPVFDQFKVELVVELANGRKRSTRSDKAIGIDLGIDNFAAISNNFNERPYIISGKEIKHINHLYNKNYAKYYSKIRQGKKEKEGMFRTRRLNSLTLNRNRKILDYMHKTSTAVINYCVEHDVGVIVVGKNKNWKQNSNIGKRNNQSFVQIPHSQFIILLRYKAEYQGIYLKVQEESYTSKASFLDKDDIPSYKKETSTKYKFSGNRVHRGLYISSNGKRINADINGSYNILKKYIGDFNSTEKKICNPVNLKNVSAGCRL